MFVAREKELLQLSSALKNSQQATLVYGKRRVGKTRLIQEAVTAQSKKVIYYECIRATLRENIASFAKTLQEEGLLSFHASFDSFDDVFSFLNSLSQEFIVIIDEYPYLSTYSSPEEIDSSFQRIIDTKLHNIHLILSGSQISMMKNLMQEKNALYGRFALIIHLKELNYREASAFYPSKTPYEKAAFYSVFGGSPFVLQQLRDSETLAENIVRTILNDSNPVHLYASNILLSDYSNSINAERILTALGNGKKKYSELESRLQVNSTGNLAKQLKAMLVMELLSQRSPINRLNDPKKKYYEINDNLMRFYYHYVYANKSALQMIGPQAFFEQVIAPTLLTDFVPHRFEDICRAYFSHLAQAGKLPGITDIGTYYYDDPKNHRNGEFDVALAYSNQYELYEAKYYKKPMTLDAIHKEAGQVREIDDLSVTRLGFIACNGFIEKDPAYIYYTGEDLYS